MAENVNQVASACEWLYSCPEKKKQKKKRPWTSACTATQQLKQFSCLFNCSCKKKKKKSVSAKPSPIATHIPTACSRTISVHEGFDLQQASSGPCWATLHFQRVGGGFGKGLERTVSVAWFWEPRLLAQTHYWHLLVWVQSRNFNSRHSLCLARSSHLVHYSQEWTHKYHPAHLN